MPGCAFGGELALSDPRRSRQEVAAPRRRRRRSVLQRFALHDILGVWYLDGGTRCCPHPRIYVFLFLRIKGTRSKASR